MKCPVCKDVTLLMSERQGIEIDYCPECRGIWLDRGELDKILEKEKSYRQKHDSYDEDYDKKHYKYDKEYDKKYEHNEHYYDEHSKHKHPRKRKKESFMEDIFDIF